MLTFSQSGEVSLLKAFGSIPRLTKLILCIFPSDSEETEMTLDEVGDRVKEFMTNVVAQSRHLQLFSMTGPCRKYNRRVLLSRCERISASYVRGGKIRMDQRHRDNV